MTFTDKLKELREKATKGPWTFDPSPFHRKGEIQTASIAGPDGRSLNGQWRYPCSIHDARLIIHLINHSEEIEALVEAAKPFADLGCPRTFDGDSSDVLALRSALSRLDGGKP